MKEMLSLNTRAILLLTAPLITGRADSSADLLSPGEYKNLARHLREIHQQPADLVSANAAAILQSCSALIKAGRLQKLLGRGFLLSQAIERWHSRAIWVVSRADGEYPRRIKNRLREDAPAVLYGCGDRGLLELGGLAVVGSRHVDDALIDYSLSIGMSAARAGRAIVSGGAKGVDQAAMQGAVNAGGKACGVLADSLGTMAINREHRNFLLDGKLALISPYDPSAGFNVGHAMQRNKLIYALSDASLVVNADFKKGGTWSGAVEQLEKFRFVPVFVRSTGEPSIGLEGLRKKGALPWPNPGNAESFSEVFKVQMTTQISSSQIGFPMFAPNDFVKERRSDPVAVIERRNQEVAVENYDDMSINVATPSESLFAAVRRTFLKLLSRPMKDIEVAAALDISRSQARVWLQRLVDEGLLEAERKKPPRYWVKQKSQPE